MTRLVISLSILGALLVADAAPAEAQERLTVTFDTSPANPQFNNQNIVAVWIEDAQGNYVNTIGYWSAFAGHRRYLYDWLAATGRDENNPVPEGLMGGTFGDYQTGLMLTWNFANPANALVPDGMYTVQFELADRNSGSSAENNRAAFTVDKNGTSAQVTGSMGGFNNVTLDYVAPDPTQCGNGALDPGETCDDSGGEACPSTCEDTGDVCMPATILGSASECTAECVVAEITQCVNGDGCCPAGCNDGTDDDCTNGANAEGACNASGSSGGPLTALLLIACLLGLRRRR